MARIKLLIEYDGTAYHGSQIQINGHTIQAELERGIERLTGETVSVLFAGRTDAGVHALGQVAAFDTRSSIPPERWQFALNSVLPGDIRVLDSIDMPAGFHPRFDAVSKLYRYQIYRQKAGAAFHRHHAYCCFEPLDIKNMQKAAQCLEGQHDFRSFCASGSPVKQFVRAVSSCRLLEEGPFLYLEIVADGFLYNMVRIIMGTLLEIGRGRLSPQDIESILAARDRSQAGPTAPPQGLYLVKVNYN